MGRCYLRHLSSYLRSFRPLLSKELVTSGSPDRPSKSRYTPFSTGEVAGTSASSDAKSCKACSRRSGTSLGRFVDPPPVGLYFLDLPILFRIKCRLSRSATYRTHPLERSSSVYCPRQQFFRDRSLFTQNKTPRCVFCR